MRNLLVACLLVATFVLLAACGNAVGGKVEVSVTLNEYGIRSSLTEFTAGVPYRFIINNEGKIPHEIMIVKPIPVMEGMEMPPMEELDAIARLMVEADKMPAGSSYSMEFTFPESAVGTELEFSCHTPGHYEAGMKLPITVK